LSTHSLSLSLSLVTRHLIRITHASRRPFLLVFLTGEKRADWVRFLTQYIAVSFLSPAYLLAEKLKPVDGLTLRFRLSLSLFIDGIYVVKKMSPVTGPPTDVMTSDQKKCYLYIDWNSSVPTSWCLRYSSMRLAVSNFHIIPPSLSISVSLSLSISS
jgi:hypothetical protein